MAVERWISRYSPKASLICRREFSRFLQYLKTSGSQFAVMSPEELVRFQRSAVGEDRFLLLDQLELFIQGVQGRASYKRHLMSSVRGFFMHSRAELPADRSFIVRGDIPRVTSSLSVEELQQILVASNLMYRSVFLAMFQGGMGSNEVIYWSRNGLEATRQQLASGVHPLRVDLPGRKRARNERPFHTYLGSDAIQALRAWMLARPDGSDIFILRDGTPLNYFALHMYWNRRIFRAGFAVKTPEKKSASRYGKSLHELRDLFRSRWEKSGASGNVAEYCMGHVVDPYEYNKAFRDVDYTSREYRKAEQWLNILSINPEVVPLDQVQSLQDKTKELEEEVTSMKRVIEHLAREIQLRREEEANLNARAPEAAYP